jgi:hypothetical protein
MEPQVLERDTPCTTAFPGIKNEDIHVFVKLTINLGLWLGFFWSPTQE